MDAHDFDALLRRLASPESRRRVFGLLAATPVAGSAALLAGEDNASARRKKKKSKKNRNRNKNKTTTTTATPTTATLPRCDCAPCETCVNGTCEPKAEGARCGMIGVCVGGLCARSCGAADDPDCPVGTVCGVGTNLQSEVCLELDDICNHADCGDEDDCAAGEACFAADDCSPPAKHCATIVIT